MAAIVCELCGSNDLLKKDGLFVCQHCGTKYTIEEARKMLSEEVVEVQGTVKIDNTDQIKKYLDLSQNAYESRNGQSALDYANKALEIIPENSRAWIAKMYAIEYVGTFGNLRLKEVIEAGKNAILYAIDDEKRETECEVYGYELLRALSLLKLATQKMAETESVENEFQTFARINFLTASNNMIQADRKIVNLYEGVANEAIAMALLVPDNTLAEYSALSNIMLECAKQYQFETDELIKRYKIYGASLLDSAKQVRNNKKKALEDKANNALTSGKEQREKRREEYWKQHQTEREDLLSKKSELELTIRDLNMRKETVPGMQEKQELEKQIRELETEKKVLGMFKGKERLAKQTQIDMLKTELTEIDSKVNAGIESIQEEINRMDAEVKLIDLDLMKDR